MATVTPILRTSQKDKRGRCPVWLRISDRDRSRFVSLSVKVLPSQWNPRQQRVRKGHPNADLINQLITERLVEGEAEVLRLKLEHTYATASGLKAVLQPGEDADFFTFAVQHLVDLEKRGKIGRYRRLKATLGKLQDFADAPLPFDRITPRLLTDWETHLLEKGNKQSTIATNFRDLKTLVNRATREGVLEPGDRLSLHLQTLDACLYQ